MKKFPKILQYRQLIRDLKFKQQYVGEDSDGNAILDKDKKLTPVRLVGREKLHGTNGGIVINFGNDTWQAQSRERVLFEDSDNAGFYQFVKERIEDIKHNISDLDSNYDEIVIFGEFCGGNIQKGVALNQLEKMFVVFGLKGRIKDQWEWMYPDVFSEIPDKRIFNINHYSKWEIEIDLNYPERAIEEMTKWTLEVEEESPFCKSFGVSDIGEGIVFSDDYDFNRSFKSKGEKHSNSKVRKLPSVDIEKLNSVDEFIAANVTEERLQQAFDTICYNEQLKDIKQLGNFIRWINNDVWSEESDSAEQNDIDRSLFGKRMSPVCVKWFKEKLEQF